MIGAALIWDEPDGSVAGTKVWDDVDDIEAITSMPDEVTHSITDKVGEFMYDQKDNHVSTWQSK